MDPIELVLWMPTLCMKKNIPFVIFRSKARLGTLVHKKTASCLSITDVRPEHANQLKALERKARHLYNTKFNFYKKQWGKRVLGTKTRHKIDKMKRLRKAEAQKRKAAIS